MCIRDSAKVLHMDYAAFLLRRNDPFDIAFLDPPYRTGLLQKALPMTAAIMNKGGVIVCEHPDVYKRQDVDIDDRDMDRMAAIILSMTKEERAKPSIINPSRKRRIAAGSGMRVEDVNRLLRDVYKRQQYDGAVAHRHRPAHAARDCGLAQQKRGCEKRPRRPVRCDYAEQVLGGPDQPCNPLRGGDGGQRLPTAGDHPAEDPLRIFARQGTIGKNGAVAGHPKIPTGPDHHHARRAVRRAGQGGVPRRCARLGSRYLLLRRNGVRRAHGRCGGCLLYTSRCV